MRRGVVAVLRHCVGGEGRVERSSHRAVVFLFLPPPLSSHLHRAPKRVTRAQAGPSVQRQGQAEGHEGDGRRPR